MTVLLAAVVLAALIWLRPAPPPLPDAIAGKVERIVIEKAARRMTLRQGDRTLREYRVALGWAAAGDKEREGAAQPGAVGADGAGPRGGEARP